MKALAVVVLAAAFGASVWAAREWDRRRARRPAPPVLLLPGRPPMQPPPLPQAPPPVGPGGIPFAPGGVWFVDCVGKGGSGGAIGVAAVLRADPYAGTQIYNGTAASPNDTLWGPYADNGTAASALQAIRAAKLCGPPPTP